MTMLQNVGVNTETKRKSDGPCGRSPSTKLKERNVKHTRINGIKDLNDIYIYGEMLGRGVFGTVVEITDKSTKKIWALKIVDKKSNKGTKINTIENEIRILRMVNHPHIVYLERTFESYKHIYLVIEKCTAELATILKRKKHFTEDEVRKIMDHLSSAIAYLHKYEIVHRDLKVENILTAPNPNDPSDELYIKVSDFGLGIIKSCSKPDQMISDRCGTLTYMAPEIITRSSYSQQCDVWAMGVICYLLLTGNHPFYSKNENELVELICKREPSYSGFTTGSEVVHLIMKMLDKNPALRISAAEVCRHPWIRGDTIGSSSPNVLDMMQLWRAEMMVQPTNDHGSDWAEAFISLEQSTESTQNKLNKSLQRKIRTESQIPNELTRFPSALKNEWVPKVKSRQDILAVELPANNVPCETGNASGRALNVKGKNTKLIRIGKVKKTQQDKQCGID